MTAGVDLAAVKARAEVAKGVARDAVLSDDGVYRYTLSRQWGDGGRHALFVMLNPSVADHTNDDPTITRCIGFAKREGCDGLNVVNLWAYIATKPPAMFAAADRGIDVVGPENDQWIESSVTAAISSGAPVIAAWGANAKNPHRVYRVRQLFGGHAQALGFTDRGMPRHPLMLRSDTPLVPYVLGASS